MLEVSEVGKHMGGVGKSCSCKGDSMYKGLEAKRRPIINV